MKPHLLLDIDGVLCPFGCQEDPEGYRQFPLSEDSEYHWVWVSPTNISRLKALAERFELVWATAWEHKANDSIGPYHELPPLKVIEFLTSKLLGQESLKGVQSWKLPWVKAWAELWPRPLAWIDDDIYDDAIAWAQERTDAGIPTRVIKADCATGLTDAAVDDLLKWCHACSDES